jgi:molybdopterin/thiamine biosynthesis adenylyltransferase
MLSADQIERYSRQILLSEVGPLGQERLLASKVLLVGLGGLGSPAALYLAAAGVGTLGLIDPDRVNLPDLQRQTLYRHADLGRPKVEAARARLSQLNPDITICSYRERLTAQNALDMLSDYDVILDGSDNFPTRYLVNDACVLLRKSYVHGSAVRFEGQVLAFLPSEGPCYRCLYPAPPPAEMIADCAEAGIWGPLAGLTGTLQASQALTILLGQLEILRGRLLLIEGQTLEFHTIEVRCNPNCPACGDSPRLHVEGFVARDYQASCML